MQTTIRQAGISISNEPPGQDRDLLIGRFADIACPVSKNQVNMVPPNKHSPT